jgi:hypothetical protein
MIAIFADQHMGQQPWTGAPPVDGATGQGGLGEGLTARAGHARAGDFADHEAPRDILQLLRHILTKGPQGPAAFGAGFAWRQNLGLALQVVGQWGAAVLGFVGLVVTDGVVVLIGFALLIRRGFGDLSVFLQIERQLVDALGFRPEPRLAVAGELSLQVLDLQGQGLDFLAHQRDQTLQLIGVFGQRSERFQHVAIIPDQYPRRNRKRDESACFIGLSGLQRTPCLLRHAPVNALQEHRQLRRAE